MSRETGASRETGTHGAGSREAEVPVTFEPASTTVHVLKGTRLLEATAGANVVLDMPCGGEGVCGKCRVKITRGACPPTSEETELLSAAELQEGLRLACQSSVCGPMTVEVPETSLLPSHHKILVSTDRPQPQVVDPAVRKQYVELPPPARNDDDADLLRLENHAGPFKIDLDLLRRIPRLLRDAAFRGTAVIADGRLIDFEPGNTVAENFAVAVDIGTTTLAAVLLDVNNADELAVASRLNPQAHFGDDVLSRILHAREDPHGLNELSEVLVDALNEMIGEMIERVTNCPAVCREKIYELTFSGNTTMQQLLCRVDPSSLGELPFVATAGRGLLLRAARLGLDVHPRARACIMPAIGGFVGGDTVSGILATSLTESAGPALLVDIGTNGEVVLYVDGKLRATSTAAGPAFEGARIMHGMRGSNGAIEKVVVDGRLRINVIGDVPPLGLCGSGLIDAAAELLRLRIITPEGRMLTAGDLPEDLPDNLARRAVMHEGHAAFLLADETETGTGKAILLTQGDIRELQLATGAIRAGINVLLRQAGLKAADLDEVLIAGGFGNFIRRSNAQRIGLLPGEIPRKRIRYRGNTSLAGAQLVALSSEARKMADRLARQTEHVDLSTDAEFQQAFAEAMIFPEA